MSTWDKIGQAITAEVLKGTDDRGDFSTEKALSDEVEKLKQEKARLFGEIREYARHIEEQQALNDRLCSDLLTRFANAYALLNTRLNHFFENDLEIYKQLVAKAAPVLEKGKEALEKANQSIIQDASVSKEELDELKEVDEELEEILTEEEEEEEDFEY